MPWRRNKRHKQHHEQKELELEEPSDDEKSVECGICKRDYKPEDVIQTPCCRQIYCMTCLKSWVKFAEGTHSHTVSEDECLCPTCRSPFRCPSGAQMRGFAAIIKAFSGCFHFSFSR